MRFVEPSQETIHDKINKDSSAYLSASTCCYELNVCSSRTSIKPSVTWAASLILPILTLESRSSAKRVYPYLPGTIVFPLSCHFTHGTLVPGGGGVGVVGSVAAGGRGRPISILPFRPMSLYHLCHVSISYFPREGNTNKYIEIFFVYNHTRTYIHICMYVYVYMYV